MYIGGLVVASIAAILFIVNPFKEKVLDINNILVIPFENLGDKSRDNFVVGISNNIVNGLNRISKNLNVIGYNENLKDLANESNSKYLITGNVQEDRDQIRLVINLIDKIYPQFGIKLMIKIHKKRVFLRFKIQLLKMLLEN